jgi:plastocyanin
MRSTLVVPFLSLAALGVAAAALVSCAKKDAAAPYERPAECALAGQPAPGARQAYVAMRGFAFTPDTLHVAVGTTVTWVNCEDPNIDPHTATASGGEWDSGYLRPGEKYAHTFAGGGSFGYACTPHPFMHGAVMVQ